MPHRTRPMTALLVFTGLNVILVSTITPVYDFVCFLPYWERRDQVTGRMIGHAKERNGLYYLEDMSGSVDKESRLSLSCSSENLSPNKTEIWLHHLRLGHPSFSLLKTMFPSLFRNVNVTSFHCDTCELAKHHRVSFPLSNSRSSKPFSLIHTDIWGPSRIPNISGARWFVSFIDDCTRTTWLFLMKEKSETSNIFQIFYKMINTQFGVSIKRVRSDNARDYFNHILSPFFQEEGVIHESSCVDTPQQNRVAERKNGHLLNVTRALLFQNSVPKSFWGEAVLTAAYLINRMPSRVLGYQSPINVLSKFFPDFNGSCKLSPKIFGCVSFVHIHNHHRDKLDPRALKCIFVGYSTTKKGYKCYHPITRKIFISMDVTFVEKESFFQNQNPHLLGERVSREDEDEGFLLEKQPTFSSKQPTFSSQTESKIPAETLLPEPDIVPESDSKSAPDPEPKSATEKPESVPDDELERRHSGGPNPTKPLQVYSRRGAPVTKPETVQESEPETEPERESSSRT